MESVQDFAGKPFRTLNETFEKWQIQKALSVASEKLTAEGFDPYSTFSDEAMAGNSPAVQRFKELFRQELLVQAGLRPDYSDSEFISSVDQDVATQLELKRNNDVDLKHQLEELSQREQFEKMAVVEADIFATIYVQKSIQDEQVPALSPAQPGVFQKIRQTRMVSDNKPMTMLLRTAEAFFSNGHYQRGIWPKMARNIPFISDVADSALMASKSFLVSATVGYSWSSLIWHSTLPFPDWLVNFSISIPFVSSQWKTSDRIATNLGLKVNDTIGAMAKYSLFGSMMTMEGMFVYSLWGADIHAVFDTLIFSPVHEMIGAIGSASVPELVGAGTLAGAGIITNLIKKTVEAQSQKAATQAAVRSAALGGSCESVFGSI